MLKSPKADASPLVAMLNQLHPLNKGIEAFFSERLTMQSCRKGKMLLKNGQVCDHLYFITRGVLRGFIKEGDKNITTWISIDNELVTSIASLNTKGPSLENIEAIEPCELLVMKHEDLEELYLRFPEFNIVGRKLLQYYYHDAESRAFVSRLPTTEQRYNYFIKRYPHLINRIPIKHIASFIGVRLETLSRTRKKLSE